MIPLILVTGFLGSGKTTLLKRFIDKYADDKRVAVIQNEFAPTGIDRIDIEKTGRPFHVLELNNGSVFCVCLLNDFRKGLRQMAEEIKPDIIILEATGLADPIAVAQILTAQDLKDMVYLSYTWCVVDGVNFIKMSDSIKRISHQILVADTVIINKCDLISADTAAAVEDRIKKINPCAVIKRASHADVPLNPGYGHDGSAIALTIPPDMMKLAKRPPIQSAVLKLTAPVSLSKAQGFFDKHGERLYRAKGYITDAFNRSYLLQFTHGSKVSFQETGIHGFTTELVFLGPDAVDRNLDALFKDFCQDGTIYTQTE